MRTTIVVTLALLLLAAVPVTGEPQGKTDVPTVDVQEKQADAGGLARLVALLLAAIERDETPVATFELTFQTGAVGDVRR